MFVVTVILAAVLGGGFILFGVAKLAGVQMTLDVREHLELPAALFRAIGIFEVLGGTGVLVGLQSDLVAIGVLAGVGLVAMTIGAAFYHQRAGDSMKQWMPAVTMGSLAVFFIIMRVAIA